MFSRLLKNLARRLGRPVSILLAWALLAASLASCALVPLLEEPTSSMSSPGELRPDASPLPENAECRSVADYLVFWGFPSFDENKLLAIEKAYERYFYRSLPDVYTHASDLYDSFRFFASNGMDTSDPEFVTGAVILLYQRTAGDKYAVYMNKEETSSYKAEMDANFVGIGVHLSYNFEENRCVVVSTMEGSSAREAGILPGDLLVAVGDLSIEKNAYNALVQEISGEVGTTVTVTFERNGEATEYTLVRRALSPVSVRCRRLVADPSVAIIEINQFTHKTAEEFIAIMDTLAADDISGIVFDVRDNPGGDVSSLATILDYLIPDGGAIAHFRHREGSEFEDQNFTIFAEDGHSVDLPLAVMCNQNTASAGELFTAALQDYGMATVVGKTTYGKATAQTSLEFTDGTMFTVSIYTCDPPKRPCYEGIGITPDIDVSLSPEAAKIPSQLRDDGDDAQLQAAVSALSSLNPLSAERTSHE